MTDKVQVCCGNCIYFCAVSEQGDGQCYRYPPQVIVLFGQRPDLKNASVANVQQPTKCRPTMQSNEFCGEFRPAPPRATTQ